ncbi:MAG: tRNA dihydrouridine(20/20a) synthase DusA [Proteobacteria bacterium]|nr:tRNA dihydrouridine(20/20a) synthase DusA [Pseudomonadota bacterium]
MNLERKISIAPMMSYTDRHFRVLMRLINPKILLYTEMVTTGSIIHGDTFFHLQFSNLERPLALQLGGSNPKDLAHCAKLAEQMGYDEVNLNVGCPSERVFSGQFGACLMKQPELVAECVAAMQSVVKIPITVKTRIGVDQQDSYEQLCHFISRVNQAGCDIFIIHARKAWLKGLSPRENRSIPPLRYDVVYALKKDFPLLSIVINGGVKTWEDIQNHLNYVDGVMIGREAYQNPLFLAEDPKISPESVVLSFTNYMIEQLAQGSALWPMSKHLMNLFQGRRGAKRWRQDISLCREAKNASELKDKMELMLSTLQ